MTFLPVEFVMQGFSLSWWYRFVDTQRDLHLAIDRRVEEAQKGMAADDEYTHRCMSQRWRRAREEVMRGLR